MSYRQRLSLFVVIDSIIVVTAIFISGFLVNGDVYVFTQPILLSSIALLTGHLLFSWKYNLYKKAWEYASIGELVIVLKIVSYTLLSALILQQIVLQEISFRLLAVTWLLHLLFIGGSRFVWRMYRDQVINPFSHRKRTLIIGAGSAGTMVARQLIQNKDCDLLPVGFIDDNPSKQHLDIMGIPVLGGVESIAETVVKRQVDNIVIAIPSLSKKELNTIFTECMKTSADTKILPMLEDLVTGKVSVNQVRDVQVEDLLGRSPVELDMELLSDSIKNKIILVSGAGGSIGSEICRQVSAFYPKQLILLGHGENSIYTIEMELKETFKASKIEFITEIADLQDAEKMMEIMRDYQPDVVYHAAAHKHVPLMERNPEEAVKNNIMGTRNIAQAADWHGVETFVMVSTDKAVNPTSVMGASKKLAEMIVQHMGQISKTRFVAVRFGNVLGSRGSVIPHFKKQIERGGPVTVTHPDMIRYFMTIPEASKLVIQAGALAKGGEIFVLDMGEPVKIVDLAKNLIKLSGNSPDEIPIMFTGIRPGEKLYEELLKEDEVQDEQIYPKIYVGKSAELYMDEIETILSVYSTLSREELKETLLELANRKASAVRKEMLPISS
ncbi:nucleoside-diphosphate sugar epimerase/dehydratase [Jeotgalibacillus sp. ET6]|uniref:polysaccharide biosynthesis protein n=1 Tax=Jeotgalibacillus sp. ET6 TaxID=3037260 RepID=UPI0024183E5C|nr:nucleoside-diphosphate sugar epimerase/dehydratase [Jeotgalibacillus sp. ET6]MDG5472601.1 nucleoside-diphosphate sugar epimerase/dehydratase [Jeotgalibacillus sp. ET6]